MEKKVSNNVVKIPCSSLKSLLYLWLRFLKPFHKMSESELSVAALFLKSRIELSNSIIDDDILNRMVLSVENKNKIREESGIATACFRVICTRLKQKKFLLEDKINPKYVPSMKYGDRMTSLLILLEQKNEESDTSANS